MNALTRVLFLAAALAIAAPAQQSVVFRRVFNGITTTQASAPIQNIGQGLHLFQIYFPTAVADVSGFTVRVEASFDNTTYFPISRDVTSAYYSAALPGAFAIERANGVWPYVRIRAVAVNAAVPMTVNYSGGIWPIGNVFFAGDRYLGTGPSGAEKDFTFGICVGVPCQVASNLTNRIIVTQGLTISKCYITAKTAPTGAALTVRVMKNGATNIFPGASPLTLPAGSNGPASTTTFDAPGVVENDVLTIDILQVGSTLAGQDVSVVCAAQY